MSSSVCIISSLVIKNVYNPQVKLALFSCQVTKECIILSQFIQLSIISHQVIKVSIISIKLFKSVLFPVKLLKHVLFHVKLLKYVLFPVKLLKCVLFHVQFSVYYFKSRNNKCVLSSSQISIIFMPGY